MRCPKCGDQDDKVIDSRASREGAVIRRRRECLGCEHRFTTYEVIEREELTVSPNLPVLKMAVVKAPTTGIALRCLKVVIAKCAACLRRLAVR